MTGINYYLVVDSFMKDLYKINRLWFEVRDYLKPEDLKRISHIQDSMGMPTLNLEYYLKGIKKMVDSHTTNKT